MPHPGRGPARLVYCAGPAAAWARRRLDGLAEVVAVGDGAAAGGRPALAAVLADLSRRGVRRLMVEGGADLGRQFLTGGLVDELQLVIAPFFVGDPGAPRFAGPGRYPFGPSHPVALRRFCTRRVTRPRWLRCWRPVAGWSRCRARRSSRPVATTSR